MPTAINSTHVQKATVKVIVRTCPDTSEPWEGKTLSQCSGSGFILDVLSDGDEVGLVTNAHVLGKEPVEITIKLPHIAEPIKNIRVAYRSDVHDLAILKVKDKALAAQVAYLKIAAQDPDILDDVRTFGFPMGGRTLCSTKGILSRIETQRYSHSRAENYVLQIDAAINPGSSGGPAVNNKNEVIGVSFSGIISANNIGYVIPSSTLQRHIDSYLQAKQQGVPEVDVVWTPIISQKARELHGLLAHQCSGILVQAVDKSSAAYGHLQVGDVIVAVDGHKIFDDGTYQYKKNSRVKYTNIINHKHLRNTLK